MPEPKEMKRKRRGKGKGKGQGETSSSRVNKVKWGSCYVYTDLTPEEFAARMEYVENFRMSQCKKDDPTNKFQSADFCHKYFPIIKEKISEFADYELVMPMDACMILLNGGWLHMNFKAKHKDADDSSVAVYFAEMLTHEREVTCLKKLDILSCDPPPGKRCLFCHADPEAVDNPYFPVAGGGYVHHPVEGGFHVGAA